MAFSTLFRSAMLLLQCCFVIMLFTGLNMAAAADGTPKFSSILVFGDSVVDTGTNNHIPSFCQGNHIPYGIRFPGGIPTGRFSDGKLVPDFLAAMLGLKETVPPYLQPNLSDRDLITGVCFASACAGLDDRTFAGIGNIPMLQQPDYFKDYIERLTKIVGSQKAQEIVNEALVFIHVGGNDYLANLGIIQPPNGTIKSSSGTEKYRDFLLNNLEKFLKQLHELGCRRMVVVGVPPIGCLPLTITQKSPTERKCVENINQVANSYNKKLKNLLPKLEANLAGSKLMYIDTFESLDDMFNKPNQYGFVETTKGCCGTGLFEYGPLCNSLTPYCNNSAEYLFWDAVHPSETAYSHFAKDILKLISENPNPNI